MSPMKTEAIMTTAISTCRGDDARVCTHNDFQQMCGVTGFNPYASTRAGWYGDHGTVVMG
jgi:hypothetical protein